MERKLCLGSNRFVLFLFAIVCLWPCSPATSLAAEKEDLVVATMWESLPLNMQDRRSRFFSESEILDTLIKMDYSMHLIPGLATAWKRESPTQWIFSLRQGVKFHDSTPLDAEAVRFSLNKVIELLPYAKGVLDIAKIDALAVDKLRITTNKPFGSLPNQLTDAFTGIYGRASFNEDGKFVRPIGTGPYRFVDYKKEDRSIVEAYKGYWGKAPSIQRIIYRYLPDHNTRVLALESGEVDLAVSIPPADVARLKKDANYLVYEEPAAGLYYMTFNCKAGLFSDPRVRQAVNLMIDRDVLVNRVLDKIGIPAWEFFTPVFDWVPEKAPVFSLNHEKANKLLIAAGLTKDGKVWTRDGKPVRISLISYTSRTEMSLLAESIAGMLRDQGISVDVNLYTWGGMLDLVKKGQYDANIVFWTPELIGHPDLHLWAHIHSARNLDYSGYKNEKIDRLLEDARGKDYGPEAKDLYRQVLSIMHDESPVAPLVHMVSVAASTKKLRGFRVHPSGFFYDFKSCHK